MKLLEFQDENGNVGYKTNNGTIIPQETLLLWQQLYKNSKTRISELDKIIQEISLNENK